MLSSLRLTGIHTAIETAMESDDQRAKLDAALSALSEIVRYLDDQDRAAKDASFLARLNYQTAIS